MKAVCIGHSTYDTTLPVNEFPKENIKTRIDGHIECGGGPAANGGYLLSKWGLDTSIVSIVGNDYYGDRIIEEFKGILVGLVHGGKRRKRLFDLHHAAVVANEIGVIDDVVPVDLVDLGRGFIAVRIAVLCTSHLVAGEVEGNALAGVEDSGSELAHLYAVGVTHAVLFAVRSGDLVIKRGVVVAGGVCYRL